MAIPHTISYAQFQYEVCAILQQKIVYSVINCFLLINKRLTLVLSNGSTSYIVVPMDRKGTGNYLN